MRAGVRGALRFYPAALMESSRQLKNPGCGWYHIFSFIPREEGEAERPPIVSDEQEQLALVLIDIGRFNCREISAYALKDIEKILEAFHLQHKQMILRFTYDTQGKGLEREPQSFQLIKRHMQQLGGIVLRYAADILVLQGIFAGSWGEMHTSRYLSAQQIRELLQTWDESTGKSCFLAVRTPAQWRMATEDGPPFTERLALYNDGMFGSSTDLGTYGEGCREKELLWQDRRLCRTPNGGEALLGERPVDCRRAAADLKRMHVSYLNSAYQQEQLDFWKQETVTEPGGWEGVSGYTYIGRRLGYRFVVREARVCWGMLQIRVENTGFASLCEPADCSLILRGQDGKLFCRQLDTDARTWRSGQKTLLRIKLPHADGWEKGGQLFLQLKRRQKNGFIHFANQGAKEGVLLGGLL